MSAAASSGDEVVLGELMDNRMKSMAAERDAVRILQNLDGDDTNADLFDLIPVWKVSFHRPSYPLLTHRLCHRESWRMTSEPQPC